MSDRAGSPRITRTGAAFRAGPWRGPPPAGGWAAVFEVFASEDPAAPGMLGAYALDGDALVFHPRFSPAPALRLRAVYRPPGAAAVVAWFGGVPEPPRAPTTRIVSLTPSASIWPENILKLYITFSAPMRMGVALDHLRLKDDRGQALGGVFVEIDQELWDPQGRRVTVLFDPSRIKRGLVDNINEGPPLTQGQSYILEIDAFWRDAAGGLLAAPLARAIRVGPPMRSPIEPARWRVTPPAHATDPLIVDAPHPLDAALALRAVSIRQGEAVVPCDIDLQCEEMRLVITPLRPWTPGGYALHAAAILEDIAGNRIGRPFDVDRHDPEQRDAIARDAELRFAVPAAS
ncbi:MAG: hypothetical protein ACHP84_10515 [Caulobacterales bacterium]